MKLSLPKLELKGWRRIAAYAAFFAVSFLVALHFTFPIEAVKERLILEAAAQGWQLRMNDLSAAGLTGVRAREVTLQTRDGTRIPVEEVRASLGLLPLLLGHRSLDFEAFLFNGGVSGSADQTRTTQRLRLKANGVDLARVAALRKATGLDLAGILSADVDVTLDSATPAKSTGKVEVTVKDAAVRGGEIPVPGMGGNLTVPRVPLGTVSARGTVHGTRADFDRLEARGEDVELSAEQLFAQLQPQLDLSPIAGRARLRLSDGFWQRSGAASLRPVAELALSAARNRDGTYGFQIYGTLGKPQLRPMAQ
ncbi:MAG TPA: type II secretion system protein GspN [Anaeromyxobacteraceae bacterium]|nr:type II secretion system protein GspN [Anaeromyxobacteraceae bacterium]